MADIINNTSKFTRLGSVDEFDKTTIQKQRMQHQLLGFYKDHLIPENIYEKMRPIWFQNFREFHGFHFLGWILICAYIVKF